MMLSEPGFWIIGAGGLLVTIGFIGFAFSRNRQSATSEQPDSTPTDVPNSKPEDAEGGSGPRAAAGPMRGLQHG
jgi:hypothetical protein